MALSPLWLSIQTASLATLLALGWGVACAVGVYGQRGWRRSLWDGLLTLPLVLPPTVVGFGLLWLLGRNGPVGQLLATWGINLVFSWPATVIAATIVALPLVYRTTLGALEQVDPDLLAVARTLEASKFRLIWQILLPLASPGILAGVILAFARALGEFGATFMVAGSIPGRTQTLPIALYLAVAEGDTATAWIWTGLMVCLGLGTIAALNCAQWVTVGAVGDAPSWFRSARQLIQQLRGFLHIRTKKPLKLGYRLPIQLESSSQANQTRKSLDSGLLTPLSLQVSLKYPLQSFDLNVAFAAPPQPIGILGPSGSGKTMTLRCIAGLETPQSGHIQVGDRILFQRPESSPNAPHRPLRCNLPSPQRRVGLVPQNYALFPHLSVWENIAFGLRDWDEADRHQQVQHYLQVLQLESLADRYPGQLSGGQQQRVALARAFAPNPEVLLLDEPFSALDYHLREQVGELLQALIQDYRGVVLWVTHCREEVYRYCPQVLVLSEGQVMAQGQTLTVFDRPPTLRVARLLGCQNISRLELNGEELLKAMDWGCLLPFPLENLADRPASLPSHVGLYSHDLHLSPQPPDRGHFLPCWLHHNQRNPATITVWVRLWPQSLPKAQLRAFSGCKPLQVTLSYGEWQRLKGCTQPWFLGFGADRLLWLTD